jgi:hypothetical protein
MYFLEVLRRIARSETGVYDQAGSRVLAMRRAQGQMINLAADPRGKDSAGPVCDVLLPVRIP